MAKKLADKSCCPDAPPAAGDVYVCDTCKMTVTITKGCTCSDAECVSLGCCGQPLCKKN